MTFTTRCMTALTGLMLSLGALAAPLEISGVKLDESIDFHGAPLQLNGAGIRYKMMFKVYVVALYLGKKAPTPEEVIATPGPKRISITALRDIDANELGKGLTQALEKNASKVDMHKLVPGLVQQGKIFSAQKKMTAGDSVTLDWVPGTGVVVSIKGKPQGEPIREIEFFNAMTSIWLGSQPIDEKLKGELLGKSP